METHGAASPGKRRGVAAALRHCCHDVSAHGVLLDDCCAPQFILFALADASDIARLENDDSMALQLPGGTAWHGAPFVDDASEVYGDAKRREPRADVSLFLLEALLCLCGTRRGRTELRRLKAYAVVRDCDYHCSARARGDAATEPIKFGDGRRRAGAAPGIVDRGGAHAQA